ncbi:2,3-bisphosphoglycerate-dependent phosphoglycerate mutase [Neorhodopirellula lusitana]|uniref:phosphoglycerate mutase (2,3-diphosphoglycerate-dependent) n=1 Tax=Neorhodopirellula lusitana TaxID=445327 RepID=A0ABY1QC42_9BACT|nr:histidine phosphatase family protein [Neorhodopirellula lusitana]SMP64124.1 2,3-bisphosphoglycerate-dependent phosphoglycerate mutase [Neorhodopirellula lusitana]
MAERICILVRHGDYHQLTNTPSAHQPFALTELGRQQATEAANRIQNLVDENGWSLNKQVHTSSLLRAWQTAQLAVAGLPACHDVVQTDRLTERCVGNGASLTRDQIEDVLAQDPRLEPLPADWKSNSHFRLPFIGAESLLESGERVASYVNETMEAIGQPGQAVLFFGHGASLRHGAHHLGAIPLQRVGELSMHHARPVALAQSADGTWLQVAGHFKNRLVKTSQLD